MVRKTLIGAAVAFGVLGLGSANATVFTLGSTQNNDGNTVSATADITTHQSPRAVRFMALQYRIVDPRLIDRVTARVDDAVDELVALTTDLVRIPTVNPPGEEYDACAHFLGRDLERRGFQVEYVAADGIQYDINALLAKRFMHLFRNRRPRIGATDVDYGVGARCFDH